MATPVNQFRLKLAPSTAYNFTVYWGDGSSDTYNQTTPSSEDLAGITHTYSTAGAYKISISENVDGGFSRIFFNRNYYASLSCDATKVTDIVQFGTPVWSSMTNAFEGCTNLSAVSTNGSVTTLGSATNFTNAWYNCVSLLSFPLIDTSKVINFNYAWAAGYLYGNSMLLKSFPLIDTSAAIDLQSTWQGCTLLTDFPLINTSNVTNLNGAWYGCKSLTAFPLIDTSKVTNFSNAWSTGYPYDYYGYMSFKSFPLIDTSKGQNFVNTWGYCTSLKTFPAINTVSATDMSQAWKGCTSLTDFPLINTSNVTNLEATWSGCTSLTAFPLIDTSKVTNFSNAWYASYPWSGSNLLSFPLIDTSKGQNFTGAWINCNKLKTFPLIDTSKGTNLYGAWSDCTSLKSFPAINTVSATNMSYAWQNCTSLTAFPLIDTSKVTNLEGTWNNCTSLSAFPAINTVSATSLYATWQNCTSLSAFSLIDTSNVTNFNNTWYNCSLLSSVKFDKFNFSKLTNGSYCFKGIKFPNSTYNSILTSLSATNNNSNAVFNAGWSLYDNLPNVINAKNYLTNKGWTIYDNGVNIPKPSSAESFIITVNTSLTSSGESNKSIRLPFAGTSPGKQEWTGYGCWVDWGDGNVEFITGEAPIVEHIYNSAGIYDIAITQNRPYGFWSISYWLSSVDKLKAINIKQLGTATRFTVLALSFYYASNLNWNVSDPQNSNTVTGELTDWLYQTWAGNAMTSFPPLNLSGSTSMPETWENCTNLKTFGAINCSNCENFSYTWNNCTSLTAFPLVDTSKGIYFSGTWRLCTSLSAFPLLDTSKGIYFNSTWQNCTSLKSFPAINTLSATDMSQAWNNCTSLTAFPLIDTSKVTSLYATWQNCTSLSAFPAINTVSATDFRGTWQSCTSLSASSFPTLNMSKMLSGANIFTGVKLQTQSYSALLTSLCATNLNTFVTFDGGFSLFNTPGSAAKVFLTKPIAQGGRSWTINDGGYQSGT